MDWVITIGAIATAWAAVTLIGAERQQRINAATAKILEDEANQAAAEAAAVAAAMAAANPNPAPTKKAA